MSQWTEVGMIRPVSALSVNQELAASLNTGNNTVHFSELCKMILEAVAQPVNIILAPHTQRVYATDSGDDWDEWVSTIGLPQETMVLQPEPFQTGNSLKWNNLVDSGDWTDFENEFGAICVAQKPRRSLYSVLRMALSHQYEEQVIVAVNQSERKVYFWRFEEAYPICAALGGVTLTGPNAVALDIVRPPLKGTFEW